MAPFSAGSFFSLRGGPFSMPTPVPKNRQKIMHIEGLLLEKRLQNARARRGFGGFCRQKRLQKWNARTCTRCLIFHGSFQCIQAPGVGARIPFCKSKSRRPTRRRALCNSCRERNSQGTLRDMAGISAYLGTGTEKSTKNHAYRGPLARKASSKRPRPPRFRWFLSTKASSKVECAHLHPVLDFPW